MDPRKCIFLIALMLLILATCSHNITRPIKIGAIFHKGDEDHMSAFLKAISETEYEHLAPAFEFIPVTKYIDADSFKTAAATCELLEEGVAAIFGPSSPYTRGTVASITSRYNIPHIEYVWRENKRSKAKTKADNKPSMTINVFPDSEMVSQAIADVVDSLKWRGFVAIYENDDGLSRIQKALTIRRKKNYLITIRQLSNEDYRPILKEIRSLSICNVIIDVEPKNIVRVLNDAKEVKLLADYCNFVITYLDSSKLPISEIRNGTNANIIGLSLRHKDVEGVDSIESAVLYDAVFLLNKAMESLNSRNTDVKESIIIDPVSLSCKKNGKYQAGPNITSVMRQLSKMGKITGSMNIDKYGHRREFNIQILDFRRNIVQKAFWDINGLHPIRIEEKLDYISYLNISIQEKTFAISIKVGEPYVMEVPEGINRGVLIGNKRYEGFCIDLIEHLSQRLKFKFYYEVINGPNGFYNRKTRSWNGLIKRLLDRKADLAISDITINSMRESAVDFTMPFMTVGISLLFSKPEEMEIHLFWFVRPLSIDVWIYMATAYLVISIMLFFQARMSPGEWNNPHPCNSDPDNLENNFNMKNSFYLTISSLMHQGVDILPKAPSIRMLTSVWWFFSLIMISSYTANLAAFLTMNKMDTPIKKIEDLAKQTKIKYGAIAGGATAAFFRDSNYLTYNRMYATMIEARPSVLVNSVSEGVDRVLKNKGQYAYLIESTTLEYIMERNCGVQKIGGLINIKGFGIALPRNSPYRTSINHAILWLDEKGILEKLKNKWWVERGGKKCKKVDSENVITSQLGLAKVGGVFFVLIIGCGCALLIGIFEFLWNIRNVAVKEKITPKEALIAELKFAVNIWAETKPVKIAKSSNGANSRWTR